MVQLRLFTRAGACLLACAAVAAPIGAQAAQETILLNFLGTLGGNSPQAGVVADASGALYGTALQGGSHNMGVVFKLTPPALAGGKWTQTVLHSFAGKNDGSFPGSPLIFDNQGSLYGTTETGGAGKAGIVFKLAPPAAGSSTWTETVICAFNAASTGSYPVAGLAMDKTGALYAAALGGGSGGMGTVVKLTPPSPGAAAWKATVIHNFKGGSSDGAAPGASLVVDPSGNLYGTAQSGGDANLGVIYRLSPPSAGSSAWKYADLHWFSADINVSAGADGALPEGSPVLDAQGNLYGTTFAGGAKSDNNGGTIWQLSPPAPGKSGWVKTLLWSFGGHNDGAGPAAGLTADGTGAFYGTTTAGGAFDNGTVFKLTPPAPGSKAWTETVVYSFNLASGGGAQPTSGLVMDNAGAVYGTTFGVTPAAPPLGAILGNVFKISP